MRERETSIRKTRKLKRERKEKDAWKSGGRRTEQKSEKWEEHVLSNDLLCSVSRVFKTLLIGPGRFVPSRVRCGEHSTILRNDSV